MLEDRQDELQRIYYPYLNKYVGIGVPNRFNDMRVFFYFGTVINVSKTGIHLRKKDGSLVVIKLEDIREITTGVH